MYKMVTLDNQLGYLVYYTTNFSLIYSHTLIGIDIAYVYNGYIYHTKYDQPKYIPPGCIQRGGKCSLLDREIV